MKIYRVIDDGMVALTTDSELRALRLFRRIVDKQTADCKSVCAWIDEENVL